MTFLSDLARTRLQQVGTATISNVLLRLGFRNAYMLGITPIQLGQPRMVGTAVTLRFIPAREDIDSMLTYSRNDNVHRRAIEECPGGSVLVIDTQGNATAASAGDLMVARLKVRGACGIVTDGGYRDTPSIRAVGLPAFHARPAPRATPIALHPAELNVPIGCAGVAVYPGDVIVGDEEGVVVIPAHVAEQVATDAWDVTQYEVFAEQEVARGRSLFGLFPATDESRAEYSHWVDAGRPLLNKEQS